MKKILLLLLMVQAAGVPLTGANLIQNGSFEKFSGSGVPENWTFSVSGKAPVSVSPATPGIDGVQCLRIVNQAEKKTPHTFGLLQQKVKLRPHTEYMLRFMARGRDVNDVTWVLGKDWTIRSRVSKVTDDWKEYHFTFSIPADKMEEEDSSNIRLIIEGRCAELDIDDVRLEVVDKTQIINSSFDGISGQVPWGWNFGRSGNAEVSFVVDDSTALSGKNSLRIINNSPHKPHVFGSLGQKLKLQSGVDYVLRFSAKGEGGFNVALGSKWQQRVPVGPLTSEWVTYEREFRLTETEIGANGDVPVVIVCESLTPGVWIDDLTVTSKKVTKLSQASWQKNRVYRVNELAACIDTLKDIPKGLPVMKLPLAAENAVGKMPKTEDFSADLALGYDKEGVVLLARVTDNIVLSERGENMWKGDSLQIRIDRNCARQVEAAAGDLELGFTVDKDNKVYSWCWDAGQDPLAGELPEKLVRARGFRTDSGYFLVARLSWEILGGVEKAENRKFGFTIVANDSDGPAHRAIYFLTPGLHDKKSSDQYIQAVLDGPKPVFWTEVSHEPSTRTLEGSLLASHISGDMTLTAELTDVTGKKITSNIGTVNGAVPEELVRFSFALDITELAEGDYTVELSMNGSPVGQISAVKVDFYKQQIEALNAHCAELERLKKEFAAFYGDRPFSEYVSAPVTILEYHLPRLLKRLTTARDDGTKRHYAEQAAMTGQEVKEALADLENRLELLRSGKKLPEVWKYKSSPGTFANGWPVAIAVNEEGREEQRPMIFTGYGHFSDIDRDIEKFQQIGTNVVQVEFGPKYVFRKEGTEQEFEPDYQGIDRRLLPLMEKAWKNNVKIALLISPHYHPEWLLKKYPEMAVSSGFLQYEITHPKAVEMLQTYVAVLIGRLKESPYAGALHSICLSNEPLYSGCRFTNPWSASIFKKHMEKKYGPVTEFNRVSGRNFTDYDQMLEAIRFHDPAARFEFYTFSRQMFADWHRMLAEAVKKAWPDMPVHTKIMVFSSPFVYVSGVDPELLAEFSDYNGNDNYFHRRGRWIADWNVTAMTHEMQISAKPVSVANTENHLIPDRETRPVSNDHIYTGNFQQFVTGASTLVTWVWSDIDYNFARQNPKHVFIGNIFLRPGNIVAHAISGIDGMRLAPELRKFMDYEPEVAILYSPTASILSSGTYQARIDALYSALCFTGYRVRFLSERQLAAGNSGKTKLLYAVGASNVSRAALDGMKKFTAGGGRVAIDAESLKFDEYGNPAKVPFKTEAAADFTPSALLAQIHRTVATLPVSLKVDHASGAEGIFFRAVPGDNGTWLVNLVNYNHEARSIKLTGNGTWFDLISGCEYRPELELAPLKPQLLRFTPAN